MDYRKARLVVFHYQLGVEKVLDLEDRGFGRINLPPLVLNKLRVHWGGFEVHLKQDGIEKPLVILPFFKDYYKTLLGKTREWADPVAYFVNDIDQLLQRSDAVVWAFVTPQTLKEMQPLLDCLSTFEVCIYNANSPDAKHNVVDFPSKISA